MRQGGTHYTGYDMGRTSHTHRMQDDVAIFIKYYQCNTFNKM